MRDEPGKRGLTIPLRIDPVEHQAAPSTPFESKRNTTHMAIYSAPIEDMKFVLREMLADGARDVGGPEEVLGGWM